MGTCEQRDTGQGQPDKGTGQRTDDYLQIHDHFFFGIVVLLSLLLLLLLLLLLKLGRTVRQTCLWQLVNVLFIQPHD